jgi:molybdopterin converting factor small subunit
MTVIVRFYGALKEIIGERLELEVPSDGILFINLISKILQKYPLLSEYVVVTEKGIEVKGVTILVNGRHIVFLGEDKAVIRNGDTVDILPPLHGG